MRLELTKRSTDRKDIDFKLDLGRGADLFGLNTVCTDRSRYSQIITNVSLSTPRLVRRLTFSRSSCPTLFGLPT